MRAGTGTKESTNGGLIILVLSPIVPYYSQNYSGTLGAGLLLSHSMLTRVEAEQSADWVGPLRGKNGPRPLSVSQMAKK